MEGVEIGKAEPTLADVDKTGTVIGSIKGTQPVYLGPVSPNI